MWPGALARSTERITWVWAGSSMRPWRAAIIDPVTKYGPQLGLGQKKPSPSMPSGFGKSAASAPHITHFIATSLIRPHAGPSNSSPNDITAPSRMAQCIVTFAKRNSPHDQALPVPLPLLLMASASSCSPCLSVTPRRGATAFAFRPPDLDDGSGRIDRPLIHNGKALEGTQRFLVISKGFFVKHNHIVHIEQKPDIQIIKKSKLASIRLESLTTRRSNTIIKKNHQLKIRK